jgi:hypothetical protein
MISWVLCHWNSQDPDVLPLYIAAQNAVVIFRKIQDDRLTFECFEACLPAEQVMRKCNKIQMQFPSNPRLLLSTSDDVLSTLANLLSYFSIDHNDQSSPASRQEGSTTPSPRYITEALAGLIRGTQPSDPLPVSTTFVTKRLNDHVLGISGKQPWRRSSLWLLVRVTLQTTLLEANVNDGYGYKAFQAFFMADILQLAIQDHHTSLTSDRVHFMNAKLARRLAKLGASTEDETNRPLRTAGSIVEFASMFLKNRWTEIKENWEKRKQWVDLDPQIVQGCMDITFPNSQAYLARVINRRQQLAQMVNSFDKRATEKELTTSCGTRIPYNSGVLPSSIGEKEPAIGLFDFESWVDLNLQGWVDSPDRSHNDCLPLANIIKIYRRMASHRYTGNPEKLSLMQLCLFELWVALDRLVSMKWCELLLDYSPEVPLTLLDPLILPYFRQLERLHRVQEYIKGRHQRARRHGNQSVFDDPRTEKSFANKFFRLPLASSLRDLLVQVEERARIDKETKATELEGLNKKYSDLKIRAESLQCTTVNSRDSFGDIQRVHSPSCQKCRLKDEASSLRISPIEEPLPIDTEHSRAILFELRCPQPFAIWRDIVKEILQASSLDAQGHHRNLFPLSEYAPLSQFYIDAYPAQRVRMASSTRPLASFSYEKRVTIPTTLSEVVSKHNGQFSLYDAVTHGWITKLSVPELNKQCTFQLDGVYKPLQAYIETTSHTPNQVIAAQHLCPVSLSIDEYITFGHIRAGDRLQWRNIIRALRTQSLTFSESGVYFLILQAVWQAGPGGGEGVRREAHADLQDEIFCAQALDQLEGTLELLGDNWTQTLSLASAVVLVLRIHSFTTAEYVQQRAGLVLKKARSLAMQWISSLKNAQKRQGNTSVQSRQALVGTSLVLRATFDIEASDKIPFFSTEEEVVEYLYAGTFACDVSLDSLPSGLRILARRDKELALKLETNIARLCSRSSVLHKVIERRWDNYLSGCDWAPLPRPADRWWSSTTRGGTNSNSRVVHLDIIGGSFLVEGKALDRLPLTYVRHQTYTLLFNSEVRIFQKICLRFN